ncbi:gamma-glutamyltransferase [Pseudonocardia nigra]|uniref:gamma-glutamyltransferase n=1 Tax=Pseudonocardia nigra TaxID=1921578 RepID=UPI001C5F939C|nr:gamma-glutamyltransferase [Pseudonocardia nigra]
MRGLAVLAVTPVLAGLLSTSVASADGSSGDPIAVGSGGGVATVDADATRIGLEVLAAGGTAADAAVAAAAALGVTEPYSAGIGGGGFFVHYDAETGEVSTLDGRETAPAAMEPDSFVDPATGEALEFDRAVTSGLSVGVPGTPATWTAALERWGTLDLGEALAPAEQLAREGFAVDEEFRGQTQINEERFRAFPATADLFLPDGALPEVGSVFTNPDLADTYAELGHQGVDWLYEGELAGEIAATAADPPVDPAATIPVAPGLMTTDDLAAYEVVEREPTHVDYRGVDVYGMGPPSSGGSTVGEALNILEQFELSAKDPVQALHLYLEASRFAYADRNRYLGDPDFVDVPLEALLSDEFAAQRACLIDPDKAAVSPVPAGDPAADDVCATAPSGGADHEGPSTTHLVAADRWGDVVSYTLTIEQTGGSGITVPGRGFLLNNELTDFDFTPPPPGEPLPANAPAGGKRPRSSMAPTIVLADGEPLLALGSPGGSTIITTVLQVLVNRLDLGLSLPEAVAAPRMSQRNTEDTIAEPAFLDSELRTALEGYGHSFVPAPSTFGPQPEIGAVAALEFLDDGRVAYVAEPERRGGGSAMALDK